MIFRSESLIFEIPSGDTSNIYCKIYSQIFEEKKLSGQFGFIFLQKPAFLTLNN